MTRRFTLVALALAFAGCSKRETPVEAGIRDGILHVGNSGEPRDLDPSTAVSNTENNIFQSIFEGLVNLGADGTTLLPGAAEKWDVSPDGRLYTFHLRPGQKWSNGDPLTSADFLYSFRRVLEPTLGAELSNYADWVVGAEDFRTGKTRDPETIGFRAPDPLTFEIRLRERAPFLLACLSNNPFLPLNRAALDRFGAYLRRDSEWTKPGNLVGNGPFRLKSWRVNQAVVVEKNPFYWDAARVRLNGVVYHPIEDLDAEERAFRGGLLHVTRNLPPVRLAVYRQERSPYLQSEPSASTMWVTFNNREAPFSDVRVRRAFALVTDREKLVSQVLRDGSKVADSLTVPNFGGYTARAKVRYAPEEGRALLAQAGFPGGVGFPRFTYTYTAVRPGQKELAEALQAMWARELGVQVELNQQEEKIWLDTLRTRKFQTAASSWSSGFSDPLDLAQNCLSTSPNDESNFDSREYDAAYAAAGQAASDEARLEEFQKMDAIIAREAPILPIYHRTINYLKLPSVHGWETNPIDLHPPRGVFLGGSGR